MGRNYIDRANQLIIPPALVILLTVSIYELFFGKGYLSLLIDIIDVFVLIIFGTDLYFRWQEKKSVPDFFKKHYLDIFATIPFNWIFLGLDYALFTRSAKGLGILAKYGRLIRVARFFSRAPRFIKLAKVAKETEARDHQPHETEMKGVLSFKVILLVTVNSIMGTGIWFLTASGAKHAGPASLLSWFLLSGISIYISMCFAELTSMFPKAGGVYEFAKQSYGRFMSFVVGWTTSISGSVTIAMLLLGALQYLIPMQYAHYYIPIAIALIIVFNYIAYKGMQTSTYMLVGFAIVTIITILSTIIPGFFHMNITNFEPFFVFPSLNILLAIFFIAETFFGWESAIFLSAETQNPKKVMPKALILGTVIIAIFAILLSGVAMGVIPWSEYGQAAAPLRELGDVYFGNVGAIIFTLLVSASIIGAVASWIVASPRLLMALAEDKLFFLQFAKIHPKHKSPYVSITYQGVVLSILVIIGAGSYETLLHLLIPLILVLYSMIMLSVVILRYKKPDHERTFRVPFGKVGPIICIIFMLFLLGMFVYEMHDAWELLRISAALLCFGIPAYFFIELFYDPQYIQLRRNVMAYINHVRHAHFKKHDYHSVMLTAIGKPTKNDVILDYDIGVGGFFQFLIKKDLPFKALYAIDDSSEEVKLFKEKIPPSYKKKIKIYERELTSIPKGIKQVDKVTSLQSLGYVQDVDLFVGHIARVMKKNATFCFCVKHSLINMSPNTLLLDDDKALRKIFHSKGLVVSIRKHRGIFTEELFLFGFKKK